MKRKGQRDIPDLAAMHKPSAGLPKAGAGAKGPRTSAARPSPNVKPQATSAKSGRRGQ